jgi:hypothetical protein
MDLDKLFEHLTEDTELNYIVESFEPTKPSGKITSKTTKKAGVQGSETPRLIKQFKTQKGNDVKVVFDKDLGGEKDWTVIFYVNDTLSDNAKSEVDPEILKGVLWIMLDWAKKGKVNTYEFSAWKGEGDTKIVKNMNIEKPIEELLNWVNEKEKIVKNYEVTYKPYSNNVKKILKKKGRSEEYINKGQPSLNKENILKAFSDIKEDPESPINRMNFRDSVQGDIKTYEFLGKSPIEKLDNAIRSHSDSGVPINKNRRKSLYNKLIKRYLSDVFNVSTHGDSFTLKYIGSK